MEYSNDQKLFFDKAINVENLFLSGKAGTGKSFIVKQVVAKLQSQGKNVLCCAPTGIAANNINGATIHSTFSLKPFGVLDFEACNFMKSTKKDVLKNTDTIVIDEISMVRPDILDAINWTLQKNGIKPLSDFQIIFVGDMKQLGIVADDNMKSMILKKYDGFTFDNAKCFESLNVKTIELSEIKRQNNPEFIEALNTVREGKKHEYFRQFSSQKTKGIILCPHNSTVQKYNLKGLSEINEKEIIFTGVIDGKVSASDFNLELEVKLKHGCKIMYLANSVNNNLFNGSIGIFIVENNNYFIEIEKQKFAIDIQKFSKKEYVVNQWTKLLELQEIGSITQIPVKLAYAISIHKSQGMTFDEITVDLTMPCFQKGQLYVALSRVKTPQGLNIII